MDVTVLPNSHCVPLYPSGHSHWNPSEKSIHVAPFSHGSIEHVNIAAIITLIILLIIVSIHDDQPNRVLNSNKNFFVEQCFETLYTFEQMISLFQVIQIVLQHPQIS